MFVVKRDGRQQPVEFDKITERIRSLCYGESMRTIDPVRVAQDVIKGVCDGITTEALDVLAAETSAYRSASNPAYDLLAARIAVSNLHKSTPGTVREYVKALQFNMNFDCEPAVHAPLLHADVAEFMLKHANELDSYIDMQRDFEFGYFGFKTLERSYLLRSRHSHDQRRRVMERPQFLWLRVAVGIHWKDIQKHAEDQRLVLESIRATYSALSQGLYTHATPTLFNAGTQRPQMSSCFLATVPEDSIDGIFASVAECAKISKYAGGIGLSIHNIRSEGSYIAGTHGHSNGIVPMLRVFDTTARYVDQGGGKRKGSFAMYLEPWHADILEFLELKKNTGKEEHRARDLFYAMWIPDLFMQRVVNDESWSLFCPSVAKRSDDGVPLYDLYGEAFEELYVSLEKRGLAKRTIRAQELFSRIMASQIETGTPYMLYKDHINRKNNQANLGTIRSSNLCAEITEFSSQDETAVCNLASLNLSAFIKNRTFDFSALESTVRLAITNLNRVIDANFYPVDKARASNVKHRPVGLGVQGFADTLAIMGLAFDSDVARVLNREIFETMYFAALSASHAWAVEHGAYASFRGSPASRGILQCDLWGAPPDESRHDWAGLRSNIAKDGLGNSLLIALMPTASTSQILGNNEAFEPFTSNLYTRRTLAGDFMVVNRHLVRDLMNRGLWTEEIRQAIMASGGSVQGIASIPQDIQDVYKTAWELKQKVILDMAADRGPFVDQSQSMNVFMANPTPRTLGSMHMYGWRRGLKTGMYYLRTRAAVDAIQFTVSSATASSAGKDHASAEVEGCVSCSA